MPLGGDVIQLTHKQSFGNQQILNVYYFEAVDGTADLSALASWFNTNIVPKVKALQTSGVVHNSLNLVNLFNTGEVYELALSGTGTIANTDGYASFVAAAIRFPHSTAGLRTGYKRYGGLDEAQGSASTWVAGFVTLLQTLGSALINPLSPALATWVHVIVKRIAEADPVTGEITYGLPESQQFATLGYPTSYEVETRITTQNSRKWYT